MSPAHIVATVLAIVGALVMIGAVGGLIRAYRPAMGTGVLLVAVAALLFFITP